MLAALVDNNIVTAVVTLPDDSGVSLEAAAQEHQLVIDITDLAPQPQVGWLYYLNSLVPGAGSSLLITTSAFNNRFTMTELSLFYAGVVAENTTLMILKDKLMLASYVDLERQDTQQLVQILVSMNILTQARATQILTQVPTPIELYRG